MPNASEPGRSSPCSETSGTDSKTTSPATELRCTKCGKTAAENRSKYCGDGRNKDNEHDWRMMPASSTPPSTSSRPNSSPIPLRIVVHVKDGLVEDVSGIPPGVEVEIRDYDVVDEEDVAGRDETGDYASSVYSYEPVQP